MSASSTSAHLERRPLGKTGFDVSVLGWGGAPAAILDEEAQKVTDFLFHLLDQGMNLIDTATGYPGSHDFIGQHLSSRRDDFVLVSKVGSSGGGFDAFKPDLLKQQVDDALTKMKIDQVDVMLLHSPQLEVLKAGEALGALIEAREAGKIRFCGVSADNESAAYACGLPDVAVLETSINIADQANIDIALPIARENNVGVIAKRPLANAAWRNLEEQRGFYKNYAATYTQRLSDMQLTPPDIGMTDAAWAEMALRFTLSQPGVTTAIIGTTSPHHAKANLVAAHKGLLPADAVNIIRDKFRKAPANDGWTGQT